MRVAFVIPYFETWGGPAHSVRELATRVVSEGHEASIFTTDVGPRGKRMVLPASFEGVEVRAFRNLSNRLAGSNRAFFPVGFPSAFRREVASFDVVHIVEYRHFLGVWAARQADRAGVPVVLAPHGSVPIALQHLRLKHLFDRLWGHRLMSRVDHFQALTAMEARALEDAGVDADRITVIPNGVGLARRADTEERDQARVDLEVSPSDIVLLYLGRLHPAKGLMPLLEVVGDLRAQGVSVVLLVAGADDGVAALAKSFVRERSLDRSVRFLGFVSAESKRRVLVAADIFVSLSQYETMSMAVLEALSNGLAAVVSAPAVVEGLESSGAGVVISGFDPGEVCRVILDIAESADERHRMGEAGRSLIGRDYSWDRLISEYLELYGKLT